jgi:D-glycero-D-manno-heptose 1,7-bisphosphate phosphatase
MNIKTIVHKDNNWTLFLDRDGVLNNRPSSGYVTHPAEFSWIPGSISAVSELKNVFKYIIIVSNQQGIGKKLMKREDLFSIHNQMLQDIHSAGGRIDAIFFAEGLRYRDSLNRKPSAGMFQKAAKQFPGIDPSKSVIAGDTLSDMLFGHRLGMHTVLISQSPLKNDLYRLIVDYQFNDLLSFSGFITQSTLR